ncbi:zf-HC2 domain-containing protein [Streptomyces sp. NPDC006296]|uniref:zf-HC2 domain-containing protein n=1 Tax=Streptomyces sp. NPDC006296 TaxID=3156746 RepID=UPI0033B2A884
MTSAADTAQHPDASEIADLTEGLLPPAREAAVRHHLASCADCDDVRASLEEIRSLLGTAALPLPEHMPEDVSRRIDAALAQEAASAATTQAAPDPVSRETYDLQTESSAGPRPAGRPRGATGPGRGTARRRRRRVILGTAFGAAAVGMSVFLFQILPSSQDGAGSMADHGVSATEKSQEGFSEGTLEGRVHTLLQGTRTSEAPGSSMTEPPGTKVSPEGVPPEDATPGTRMLAPIVEVPRCVQQGTGREAPVLAVEEGSYEGTAAFLVVLPHASDSSRVQAYVVDAACVDSAPAAKGRLLLTHSYSRH